MKSLSEQIKGMMKGVALVAAALFVAACDPILDNDYGDCTVRYHVKFKYDYNMLNVDAFETQVDSVRLYAFDPATGVLVHQATSSCRTIMADGGRMTVEFNPADYHLVTWCHNVGCRTTEIPDMACGKSCIDEMRCRIGGRTQAADGCTHVCEIGPIFHGEEVCPEPINADDDLNPTYMVPLVKNTNNVVVALQHLGGQPLPAEDFEVVIVEENGLMNYDNSLLSDEELTYVPVSIKQGEVEYGGKEDEPIVRAGGEKLDVLTTEFTVGRLMADRRPRLIATNRQTGKQVFNIPLTDYLKMLRSESDNWSDQEYFDRVDRYHMTFLLDEKLEWKSLSIEVKVLKWRVVINNVALS